MRKIKPFRTTSRGGRRQVLLRDRRVASVCERVSQQTGYPFQRCFDELIQMFVEGHVFGVGTQDKLFERVVERMEQ